MPRTHTPKAPAARSAAMRLYCPVCDVALLTRCAESPDLGEGWPLHRCKDGRAWPFVEGERVAATMTALDVSRPEVTCTCHTDGRTGLLLRPGREPIHPYPDCPRRFA